jgi:hypothetical protein
MGCEYADTAGGAAMIEFARDRYPLVVEVAEPPTAFNVEARSVLSGLSPGRVFVDRLDAPEALLVWCFGIEGVYLIGKEFPEGFSRRLDEFSRGELKELFSAEGYTSLEISGSTREADQLIQAAFSDRDLKYDEQWVYRSNLQFSASDGDGKTLSVAEALDLDCCDAHLGISRSVEKFWGDADRYRQFGLGYCSAVDGMPVSLCMSAFVDGAVHCVELETAEAFRRQGHATVAAKRLLAECATQGLTVHWDCMAENEGSWRTATKIGLERIAEYRCWYFEL